MGIPDQNATGASGAEGQSDALRPCAPRREARRRGWVSCRVCGRTSQDGPLWVRTEGTGEGMEAMNPGAVVYHPKRGRARVLKVYYNRQGKPVRAHVLLDRGGDRHYSVSSLRPERKGQ